MADFCRFFAHNFWLLGIFQVVFDFRAAAVAAENPKLKVASCLFLFRIFSFALLNKPGALLALLLKRVRISKRQNTEIQQWRGFQRCFICSALLALLNFSFAARGVFWVGYFSPSVTAGCIVHRGKNTIIKCYKFRRARRALSCSPVSARLPELYPHKLHGGQNAILGGRRVFSLY